MANKLGFWFGIGILGIISVAGLFTGINMLISEKDLSGATNDIPWGLLISAYAFFVSSIGCCFIGSLGSVFKIKKYEPIEKRAIFLAIVIVLVGMAIIFVELGHPFRMFLGYVASPNLTSPIWWMGVNYTSYLIFIIWELLSLVKNNLKMAQIAGVFALLSAIAARSISGSVFGIVQARPFWFGPYMPIDFILCAWILGFALMIIVSYFASKEKPFPLVTDMGKWLAVVLGINMFFVFWKCITGIHSVGEDKYFATMALLTGPLSIRFWLLEIIIGLFIPFILLIMSRKTANIFVASVLTVIGMFVNKMNMVEAGQIVPLEIKRAEVFSYLEYSPTMTEITIVAAAISFIILLYSLTERYYFVKEG